MIKIAYLVGVILIISGSGMAWTLRTIRQLEDHAEAEIAQLREALEDDWR
nr:hypothetical protein [uncultured archaeon]